MKSLISFCSVFVNNMILFYFNVVILESVVMCYGLQIGVQVIGIVLTPLTCHVF